MFVNQPPQPWNIYRCYLRNFLLFTPAIHRLNPRTKTWMSTVKPLVALMPPYSMQNARLSYTSQLLLLANVTVSSRPTHPDISTPLCASKDVCGNKWTCQDALFNNKWLRCGATCCRRTPSLAYLSAAWRLNRTRGLTAITMETIQRGPAPRSHPSTDGLSGRRLYSSSARDWAI